MWFTKEKHPEASRVNKDQWVGGSSKPSFSGLPMTTMRFALCFLSSVVMAQDPAEGWMAYAVGALPSNVQRITKLEMTWTVGAEPERSFAFFSPWFGMDPSDNLNLIQPVNPWSGRSWSMYTEYFQWSPVHNSNSRQRAVRAGDTLRGSLVYNHLSDSYFLSQTVVETGETSSQTVKCQSGKRFLVPYVVYEKVRRHLASRSTRHSGLSS